ncbi:MAG: prolyl oligopeptidase family serine peptidase [bacterium]
MRYDSPARPRAPRATILAASVRVVFAILAAHLAPLLVPIEGLADVIETGFLNRNVTIDDRGYRYQVFVPASYDPARSWPVILFLHGSGERGGDGLRQTQAGLGNAIRFDPERFPFLVVFPQAPADSVWLGAPARAAIAALDTTLAEYNADRDRVILTGLSMGGYGAWHLAWQSPERFAAIVAICGGVVPSPTSKVVRRAPETIGASDPYAFVARRVAAVPAWIFHGADDPVVPVTESRELVRALRDAGADPRYTEYAGVGHGSWEPAYADTALWRWVSEQRRAAPRAPASSGPR